LEGLYYFVQVFASWLIPFIFCISELPIHARDPWRNDGQTKGHPMGNGYLRSIAKALSWRNQQLRSDATGSDSQIISELFATASDLTET
jgi:hypothetical protein